MAKSNKIIKRRVVIEDGDEGIIVTHENMTLTDAGGLVEYARILIRCSMIDVMDDQARKEAESKPATAKAAQKW